jgi:transposase
MARKRLKVLRLAEKLGNISEACRRCGISRDTYYRWKRRYEKNGIKGLKDLSRAHKNHPQTTKEPVVIAVKELKKRNPQYTYSGISNRLSSNGMNVSDKTVGKIVQTRCQI